jgi:hypothetical protein
MELYTFIMEYKEGTYISQVRASDLNEAREKWAKEINISEIQNFGVKAKERLIEEMQDSENIPVKLNGLTNIWSCGALVNGHVPLINIIRTASCN